MATFSPDEIRTELANILNEIADVETAAVVDEKSFTDDLGVDSLSMMEVVMAAQEKFEVEIPDSDVEQLKTVGDAVAYISQKLA